MYDPAEREVVMPGKGPSGKNHLLDLILIASLLLLLGGGGGYIYWYNSPQRKAWILKTKETEREKQVHVLEHAVAQFNIDTGAWPSQLSDLIARKGPVAGIDSTNGKRVIIPAGRYKGPYLVPHGGIDNSGIPLNPFSSAPTGNFAADLTAHWHYINGHVRYPGHPDEIPGWGHMPYTAL